MKALLARQRLVVIMFDGFGMSYFQDAPMPTVTNTNNASICCSVFE